MDNKSDILISHIHQDLSRLFFDSWLGDPRTMLKPELYSHIYICARHICIRLEWDHML